MRPAARASAQERLDQSLAQLASGEADVVFNFENQPVQAVIKAVLGELLQENYTIASNVGGNVTFSTAKPIVAAVQGASNRLIDVEELGEEELRVLHIHYAKLAGLARHGGDLSDSRPAELAGQDHRHHPRTHVH